MIHNFHQQAFVVGLSWSVLRTEGDAQKSQQDHQKIRRQAGLLGASGYCRQSVNQAHYLGLYTAGLLQKGAKKKKLYSLALAFLAAFDSHQKKSLNAILLMPVDQDENRHALIVIEAGQVVHDKVERKVEAYQLIEKYRQQVAMNFHTFCIDGHLTQSKTVTWEMLEAHCEKNSLIQPLPKNLWKIAAISIGLLFLIAGIYYYQKIWQTEKNKTDLALQQQLNNHTPKYLNQLQQQLSHLAWTPTQLERLMSDISLETSYRKGWALSQINCDFGLQQCDYHYTRVGGQTNELVDWAEQGKKVFSPQASKQDNLVLLQALSKPPQALQLSRQQLPAKKVAQIELDSFFQHLLNAQLQVSVGAGKVWPQQEIDLNKVDARVQVLQTPIEIKLPWALRHSTMSSIPPYVAWRHLSLQISHDSSPNQALMLTLKGHHYVQAGI